MSSPGALERTWWTCFLARQLVGQARFARRSREAILADQSRRVRSIVATAYAHVPHYRETLDRLGLVPADFQSAADLSKLPILERAQLQREPEAFLPRGRARSRLLEVRSGGSSGAPSSIHHDTASLLRNAAVGARVAELTGQRRRAGARPRQLVIDSDRSAGLKMTEWTHDHTWVPRWASSVVTHRLSIYDPPEKNAEIARELAPDIIGGFSSYLERMLREMAAGPTPPTWPRIVLCGGDPLSEAGRRFLVEECGIQVFSAYQATECLRIGFECEAHLGLHVHADLCAVRVVDRDGRPQPPGVPGDVVISNLFNRGTVLLNYRIGDVAAWLPQACPCGRGFPLLSFVEGRSDEFLTLPSGREIHGQGIRTLFADERDVWLYQVVQRDVAHLLVRLVVSPTCDREVLAARLRDAFARRIGAEVAVELAFVPDLERTPLGKVRTIVPARYPSRPHDAEDS